MCLGDNVLLADVPATFTNEPTAAAANANVEPRDLPVGAQTTALALKKAGGYSPAPSVEAGAVAFALFRSDFVARGFNSFGDVGGLVIGAEPALDIWALPVEQDISDAAVFTRIN